MKLRNALLQFLLLPLGLAAQLTDPGSAHHRYLGVPQGLPTRVVNGSCQDADGVLWLGTRGGLCRFEGHGLSVFSDRTQQFSGPITLDDRGRILCVPEDFPDSVEVFDPATLEATGTRLDRIVAGNYAGTYHRPGQPFYFAGGDVIYRLTDELTGQPVMRLSEGVIPGSQLVYADEETYLMWLPGSRGHLEGPDLWLPLPDERVHAVHRRADGAIWISAGNRVLRMRPQSDNWEEVYQVRDSLPVGRFYEDGSGNLLFGNYSSNYQRTLFYFDDERQLVEPQDSLLAIDKRIMSISGHDFRKFIGLNTFGGYHALTFPTARRQRFVRHLYSDLEPGRFGYILRGIATGDDGSVFVHKDGSTPKWFRYHPEQGRMDTLTIRNNFGYTAEQAGCGMDLLAFEGRIFGTNCQRGDTVFGQIYAYDYRRDDWQQWELPVRGQIGRSIVAAPEEGKLLVVSEDAVAHRRGRLFHFWPASDRLEVVGLATASPPLRGRVKRTVYDPERHVYWIGTTRALYAYNPVRRLLTPYTFADGRGTAISEIVLEEDGRLLLGTLGEGVQRFDPDGGRFTRIGGVAQGQATRGFSLPSDHIAGIALTERGDTLITTFNGLYLHTRSQGSFTFTTEDGLGDNEFNSISLHYDEANATYYAGGINGMVSFTLEDLLPATSPYSPVLTGYRRLREGTRTETVHKLPARPAEGVRLAANNIYLTLEFMLPDYRAPERNRYQTRLVGYDPSWTPPANTHSVRYTRLPFGDYTFQLRAFDSQGRAGGEILSIPVHVARPWYREWWAYALFLGMLAAVLYAADRIRVNNLRQKIREKQRHERQVMELELKSLRQQMNPHFIFNALNSIRDYITKQRPEEAAGYLVDFSRLMRLFLESSRKRFMPVGQEVELLRHYAGLEQLRFSGQFEYEYYVDPDIDPEMDEVPSLILQPVLENAIVHGLYHRNRAGGRLRLDLRLDPDREDSLICTVTDNGVGRRVAAAYKHQPSGDHVSRATQILDERRALLADEGKVRTAIFVDDLYPDQEWTGTRVVLVFNFGDDPMPTVAPELPEPLPCCPAEWRG